ncbi:THO complex, subunit THOC1 [Pavlovales sp. CCMP2436]|nr:THO complex, subunit THOC1 [Pavlovales sp. CCMP2436]
MLLAYTLPLSERSGVNVRGTHNVNPLVLDALADGPPTANAAAADTNGADDKALALTLAAGDGEFYRTFWGLQAAFQQPHVALADEGAWAGTVRRIEAVLSAFASRPEGGGAVLASERGAALGPSGAGAGRAGAAYDPTEVLSAELLAEIGSCAEGEAGGQNSEVYFPKFLTSAKLIGLQMRDSYFRRHILTQMAIFCQTVTVSSAKGAPLASAAQQEEAARLGGTVRELLCATGPNAALFKRSVCEVLQSELDWLSWKRDGCPVFERAPLAAPTASLSGATDAPPVRKRTVFFPIDDEGAKVGEKRRRVQLGSKELNALWNQGGDTLEQLEKMTELPTVPSLESYLRPVAQQADPAEGIEDMYKLANEKPYVWKTLRLMHKTDLALDDKFSKGGLEAVAAAVLGIGTDKSADAPEAADAGEAPAMEEEAELAPAVEMEAEVEMGEAANGDGDGDEGKREAGGEDMPPSAADGGGAERMEEDADEEGIAPVADESTL